MKLAIGFFLCIASAAQTHPALGGRYVSPVISRPLGGISPPATPARSQRSVSRSCYVGPIYYVPNAYDSYAAEPQAPSVAQPMVVNNYFITKGSSIPDYQPNYQEAYRQPVVDAPAPNPGDPLVEPASYYLIAYKDHNLYSALAYWVEGDTLHYVTTQNTHNQASLSLIDVDRTYKLNADRSVPFSVPGK
jgi:hypothetical protein